MHPFYQNKNVLVTGANGFIGSFLVARLVASGATVSALVRPHAHTWRLTSIRDRITLREVDCNDQDAVNTAMHEQKPTLVFNTASTTQTIQDFSLIDTILPATFGVARTVANAAVETGVQRLVHIGTIEEYGRAQVPFKETMHEEPISPYSLGKVLATQFVMCAGTLTTLETVVVRPAAVFGPSQYPKMLIPRLIKAGLTGADFPMNPAQQLRDFVYVEDLVDGLLAAGQEPKAAGEILNLGSGRGRMVKEVVEMVNTAFGNSLNVHYGAEPYRPHDTVEFYMNSDKARSLLSWTPHTDMMESITRTVEWYRAHYQEMPQN